MQTENTRQDIRQEQPPRGGIFLSAELALPGREARRAANGAYAYAHCFWLVHRDLWPGDACQVMTLALDNTGRPKIDKNENPTTGPDVVCRQVLYFDARQRNDNTYTWRLGSFDYRSGQRTLSECRVSPAAITAEVYNFDQQGAVRHQTAAEPAALLKEIVDITEHPLTKSQFEKRWHSLQKVRQEVGAFALQALQNPSHRPYTQSDPPDYSSTLEKQASKLRQTMLQPATGEPYKPVSA